MKKSYLMKKFLMTLCLTLALCFALPQAADAKGGKKPDKIVNTEIRPLGDDRYFIVVYYQSGAEEWYYVGSDGSNSSGYTGWTIIK